MNSNPADLATITLDPPWWRCENGCEFRCAENKPPQCPVCRSVNIGIIPEVKLDNAHETRISRGHFVSSLREVS